MAENRKTGKKAALPHGMVPIHQIADPQVRDVVMMLNENILALSRRVANAEAKVGKSQAGG